MVDTFDIDVSSSIQGRALRFLSAFVAACEARGFKIHGRDRNDKESHVVVIGQTIEFRVREPTRRVDLTVDAAGKPLPNAQSIYPRQRLDGTGQLEMQLGNRHSYHRSAWRDGKRDSIDDLLNEIMVALVRLAVGLREAAEKRRIEEERRFAEAERARKEAIKRKREEALEKQLIGDAANWQLALDIRRFAQAIEDEANVRSAGQALQADLSNWLTWARSVANKRDPLKAKDLVEFLTSEPKSETAYSY